MLLEAVGAATAAAGGIVLRLSIRRAPAETRTVTTEGSFQGIANLGNIDGNATMSVGTPAAAPAPSASAVPPQKRGSATTALGYFLIVAGIGIASFGLYLNFFAAKQ